MKNDEIKDEISKYISALETNYTDTIRDLKYLLDREKAKARK